MHHQHVNIEPKNNKSRFIRIGYIFMMVSVNNTLLIREFLDLGIKRTWARKPRNVANCSPRSCKNGGIACFMKMVNFLPLQRYSLRIQHPFVSIEV